MLNIIKMTLD